MPTTLLSSAWGQEDDKQCLFLQALTQSYPSLTLSPPPVAGIDCVINKLISQLKHDHQEAGAVYWANRCWALIYWQPVYLALYSVHRHQSWISFSDFHLGFDGTSVSGFYFSNSRWLNDNKTVTDVSSLIIQQAFALKSLLENFFNQLVSTIKINTINAWRLIADCILMVILEFEEIDDKQKSDISQQWLKAFDLYDKKDQPYSQLKTTHTQDGNKLVLARKSCCMHFLLDSSNPCDSCNKY
jgi:siderophore ferric iron reductase